MTKYFTDNNLPWNDYSSYIKSKFGFRVQKISVNAGFSCPNRDGKINYDGCIYCNNESFSPFYCKPEVPITEQLKKGMDFFGKKYQAQKYLAYFQTGTNTYADINILENLYHQALSIDSVLGLVIGTRPDCINKEIIEMIYRIAEKYYVVIEFGAESTNNNTLSLINRGHKWEDTVKALEITAEYNITTGLHIILGLPGENQNDFVKHAEKISKLPVSLLKIHQMQVLKNTKLAKLYSEKPELFADFSIDEYAETIVSFCEKLNPHIIIERFTSESPINTVIAPNWKGKKNFEVSHIIKKKFIERNSFQGKYYKHEKK